MINFYPGPSRIYDSVPKILKRGFDEGIFSMNHRSDEFMDLVQKTKKILRKNLIIPKDYEIIFTSSATESWEIFGQSMVSGSVQNLYNGAFGEKWADYLEKLGVNVSRVPFKIHEPCPIDKISSNGEWVCLTANENTPQNAVPILVGYF